MKGCIWTVAEGLQRSGANECWVWAPEQQRVRSWLTTGSCHPGVAPQGPPSSHGDKSRLQSASPRKNALALKHSLVHIRMNAKHEGFGRKRFLGKFQPGRMETSARTGRGAGSLEAGTGQYHCDLPPWRKKEISRQFSPRKRFSVGREANKPSSPTAAGAAIPDAVCRADGAARRGHATRPPVTPTPVSRAVPADDKRIAGCFRDVVFLESH